MTLQLYSASVILTLLWPFLKLGRYLNLFIIVTHGLLNILLPLLIYNYYSKFHFSVTIFLKYIIDFRPSNLGWTLILLISVLWLPSYIYAAHYLKKSGEGGDARFLFFLNLSFIFVIYLGLSGNLLTLYIFYELITLSTIPLVAHNNNPAARSAVSTYIYYLVTSSICLFLPAVLYANSNIGGGVFEVGGNKHLHLDNIYLTLMLLGGIFGIAKTSIIPVSNWLPAAMAANYPTSAALHAVVVVNAGIYSLSKFISEFIGYNNFVIFSEKNTYILLIPTLGVVYAGINGIFENNIKKILAWSTISYMNLIMAILFSGLGVAYAFAGLILHSFIKITLFFILGILYVNKKFTKLSDLSGVRSTDPIIYLITSICWLILSAPPILFFGDFKTLIKEDGYYMGFKILLFTVMISTFFSFILLGRIIAYMSIKSDQGKSLSNYDTCFKISCFTFISGICVLFNIKFIYFWLSV